jgi:RNA-directed DNA polymerase
VVSSLLVFVEQIMKTVHSAPSWLLRPVPVNAAVDEKLHARIDKIASGLPETIGDLLAALDEVKSFSEYDVAVNRASLHLWTVLPDLFASESVAVRRGLFVLARGHLTPRAQARVFRRLAKDPNIALRSRVRRLLQREGVREVALPAREESGWDSSGWLHGTGPALLTRHPQGKRVLARNGLPALSTVAQMRELLGIKSERQLGYFLLASDRESGPYTRFTIPKRDGSERTICAPKSQLRWVQRQILDRILAKVPAHDAAHGFVPGRSTVTNATPHTGAKIILKFDLTDFFPTIHYYRVVGLFARLGYYVGDARFRAADDSTHLAPTLARLCCFAPDPFDWGNAVTPQGAPTSPAISNLVCRRLDARLEGLARRNGGVYTRYADDLTFSFRSKPVDLGRFRWWVDQVCHQEGFFVNQAKFRVIRASQRQVVTGIVVNDELRIPRDARRRFRAILHNCRQHGVESQARGHPRFSAWLRGFASYVYMVHPEEGTDFLRQVEELLGPEAEGETAS